VVGAALATGFHVKTSTAMVEKQIKGGEGEIRMVADPRTAAPTKTAAPRVPN